MDDDLRSGVHLTHVYFECPLAPIYGLKPFLEIEMTPYRTSPAVLIFLTFFCFACGSLPEDEIGSRITHQM